MDQEKPNPYLTLEEFRSWIQIASAVERLRAAHDANAVHAIPKRLKSGALRSVAERAVFRPSDAEEEEKTYFIVPKTLWRAADFPHYSLFWTVGDVEIDAESNDTPLLTLEGVRLNPDDFQKMLPALSVEPTTMSRAPSYKPGRPPSDKTIMEKAQEMRRRGLTTYQIASQMRHEPGFENVATTYVRDRIKGQFARPGKAGIQQSE